MYKIIFHINFHTLWGQQLYVVGNLPEIGEWETAIAKPMTHVGNGDWVLEVSTETLPETLEYRYFVNADGRPLFQEWERNHTLRVDPSVFIYDLFDSWLVQPERIAFYSSAFTKGFWARPRRARSCPTGSGPRLILKVFAPCVTPGQELAIAGDCPELGEWQVERAPRLDDTAYPEWQINLDPTLAGRRFEYKFVIIDRATGQPVRWEAGDNRVCDLPAKGLAERVVLSGLTFREEAIEWRCAGTVVPLFSLRSEHDFGVGDFGDLHQLIDWAGATGQRVIQLLPVNDTTTTRTWTDSYPYSAISIYALHPLYIDTSSFRLDDPDRQAHYEAIRRELNTLDEVDYERVTRHKVELCAEYWAQERGHLEHTDAFRAFCRDNESWLMPYATYCYLRESYGTSDFTQWGGNARYDRTRVRQLCTPHSDAWEEISFIYFLQYIAHTQFQAASDYARSRGIVLKGDLPIGVSRDSVEAWAEPEYFNRDCQAGAPPDDFTAEGQNWRLPTYNWERIAADHYDWWANRFRRMEQYFDALRVDHILGFFRIWEIPERYTRGLCGHFNPALPLSLDEIARFGFPAERVEALSRPTIDARHVEELFGDMAGDVRDAFLISISANHFALKPACDTQRKIEALFADKTDARSLRARDGLLRLAEEVLFIPDPREPDKWHPRISASHSFIYSDLSASERYAYDQLYWDFFYHRHNAFWKETALTRLRPLVGVTSMLICGEDLGMIPATVPEVMRTLQILSLEVERMPKSAGRAFSDLANLPYLAVCTPSTHDMTTLRQWWRENEDTTRRYYHEALGHTGEPPKELTPDLAAEILSRHLHTRAMFTIIPLQDWFATDAAIRLPDDTRERINNPAIAPYYWRYRMHLTLERLLASADFNEKVARLVREAGRAE